MSLMILGGEEPVRYSERTVGFDGEAGAYGAAAAGADFGNGAPVARRDFVEVRDGVMAVTFKAGKKVMDTGMGLYPRLPPGQQYTMQFRIRYPEGFQAGLHGKQLGMSGGKGYDGGRGQEARDNGDGWSIRLQFDATENEITNQLYVYHSQMPGKYGDALGTKAVKYAMKRGQWYTLRLKVTMQSAAEKADGRIEVWQDGEKRFDVGDVRFVTKEEGRVIDVLRMEMFPGGGGAVPEKDEVIEVDDVRWSAGEIP